MRYNPPVNERKNNTMNTALLIAPLTQLLKTETARFTNAVANLGSTDSFTAVIDEYEITVKVWGTMWKLHYWMELKVKGETKVNEEITDMNGHRELYEAAVDLCERFKADADKNAAMKAEERKLAEEKETLNIIANIQAL